MTTVVVQNLPGRYTQKDVMKIWPIDGTYDFMHLPYNLLQKRPLGYVFINFHTHEFAAAFQAKWHGRALPGGASKKPLEVAAAEVQGRLPNLELIKSRKLGQLEKAGFLPLVFKGTRRMDSREISAEISSSRSSSFKLSEKAVRKELGDAWLGDAASEEATTAEGSEGHGEHESAEEDLREESLHARSASWDPMKPMYVLML